MLLRPHLMYKLCYNINMSFQLRKHLKFTLINRLRSIIYKKRLGFLGSEVFIDKNVSLMRYPQNISVNNLVVIKEGARICCCNEAAKISIGERTAIGYHTFVFASENIEIGTDCMIGPFVYIVDSDHGIDKSKPMNQQPNHTASITIRNDVWIGTGANILKGVNIGEGAVIAAGAVVKDNVPPYEIWGGVPAKKISERK